MKGKKRLIPFFYTAWFFWVGTAIAQSTNPSSDAPSVHTAIPGIETKVDSIMQFAIQQKAFPGAQILVLKNDTVAFHKTYGYHNYHGLKPVGPTDLYDLASVTKILGPLPALMKLVDEGKLELDVPFSNYWKAWKHQNDKKDLTLREILSHQAGLTPYIVFASETMRKNGFKTRFIKFKETKNFAKKAYKGMYVKNRFRNKMYRTINRSAVQEKKEYRYSGLAFLLFPQLIENLTGQDYESYMKRTFYDPIQCNTLVYNPRSKALTNAIVPTEIDTIFRKSTVEGYVHDENAALLGGVSGNAGLFGTSDDVGKMMSFFLHLGQLNGRQILSESIVKEFISTSFSEQGNRRGLGFDKPLLGNDTLALADAYPSPKASKSSFGHAGFTGTFVWADPEYQMVFILLTNRVHPFRSQRGLYDLNIRIKLHDLFYSAFE
ncbi:MAG: beta-lactamase family protein [Croceitalea sp.]|nr:beta-lactamase family protein [Croceitalea sp.]